MSSMSHPNGWIVVKLVRLDVWNQEKIIVFFVLIWAN